MSSRLDVIVRVGDSETRIDSLRLAGSQGLSVTVSFSLDGATTSLTFTAERFFAFAEQLREFARAMPGKPS
jgi:hypothetical protein